MSAVSKFDLARIPPPEVDVFYNVSWAVRELVAVTNMARGAAVRLERACIARDYAGMRSAWLDLTDSPHADLGAQASEMVTTIGRALAIHAPQNGSET